MRKILPTALTALMLTACSTQPAPPPPPEAPTMAPPRTTEISADQEVAEKLDNSGQETKDQWFIDRLRNDNVPGNKETLLELRTYVCQQLERETALIHLANDLYKKGHDETQQGTIISSSMISECPDQSANIRIEDLPDN